MSTILLKVWDVLQLYFKDINLIYYWFLKFIEVIASSDIERNYLQYKK